MPENPIETTDALRTHLHQLPEAEDLVAQLIQARNAALARALDAEKAAESWKQAENAALARALAAEKERDSLARQLMDLGAGGWVAIGKPFCALVEQAVDASRLVGIEVELADGERYLIGDVHPGGMREHGEAFRRTAVVARARLRVRR